MKSLTKRQIVLLQCFHGEETWTAQQLSQKLRVSQRTVRSDIKEISDAHSNIIRAIKGSGYQLNQDHPLCLSLHETLQDKPVKTRYLHILKQILSQHECDYYELADQLFVSESTLDKQIVSMNAIIERRDPSIRIERKNNKLMINGDEAKHRQIYTFLLNHEMDQYNFDLGNYTNFFNACNINELKAYVLEFNRLHTLKLRDFEIISFILHIAIMLERVNKGNEISNIEGYQPSIEADKLAHAFYQGLHERFKVNLSTMELHYLSCLFAGKLADMDDGKISEYREFIIQIIDDIEQQYELDLHNDPEFLENLLIHLLGLDSRIRSQTFLNNPLIKDIKLHFPLLYDISVYVAMKVQIRFHTMLIEDEIGYITLHIMNAVEKLQQRMYRRIVIVNPLGNAATSYLKQKLMSIRDLTIEICGVFSLFDLEKIHDEHPDLIISFIPINDIVNIPLYICSGFPHDEDIERIAQLLKRNQKDKPLDISNFFHEDLFYLDQAFENKEEVLHFLCEQLIEKGYCEQGYEDKVLAREQIAPTAYGNYFAIPHPIEKCAKQNAIAVCILKHSLFWNNKKTKLIFLFSLSSMKDPAFDELFERLVALLNDMGKVKSMMKQKNLQDFLDIFMLS